MGDARAKGTAMTLKIIKANKGNCPHCEGSGEDPVLFEDCFNGDHYTKAVDCVYCDGHGTVSIIKRVAYKSMSETELNALYEVQP